MKEYIILGESIVISDAEENYRQIVQISNEYVKNSKSKFEVWFDRQGNCATLLKNEDNFIIDIVWQYIVKTVEILNNHQVYMLDENAIGNKYFSKAMDSWIDVINDMEFKLQDIEEERDAAVEYRKMRKESRGKFVGGGFGFKGALKGMVEAGTLNATTGMAHSVVNTFGNMGSSISASANKGQLYRNTKPVLLKALIQTCNNSRWAMIHTLEEEINMKFEYVTVEDAQKARAILKNHADGKIPEEQLKKQLISALKLDKTNEEVYCAIWQAYGDKNHGLSDLSEEMGTKLKDYIQKFIDKKGKEVFNRYCGDLDKEENELRHALQYEAELQKVYEELCIFAGQHDVNVNEIKMAQHSKALLEEIDTEQKTALGKVWDTRQIAQKVLEDDKRFYTFLKGRNLEETGLYEEVEKLPFATTEYRQLLKKKFEKERIYRDPMAFLDNLSQIWTEENMDSFNEIFSWIDEDGNIKNVGEYLKKIIELPETEVPLLLWNMDEGMKPKSGVLLTNFYLRVYKKGMFSLEQKAILLEDIAGLEYFEKGRFDIRKLNGENEYFKYDKTNFKAPELRQIGRFLYRILFMIQNIDDSKRRQFSKIKKGSLLCTCGTYRLSGEKVCPTCRTMYLEDGSTVEAMVCPVCRKYIMKGKKFCSQCGSNLEIFDPEILENTSKYCPECGRKISTEDKFCKGCGRKLKE